MNVFTGILTYVVDELSKMASREFWINWIKSYFILLQLSTPYADKTYFGEFLKRQ